MQTRLTLFSKRDLVEISVIFSPAGYLYTSMNFNYFQLPFLCLSVWHPDFIYSVVIIRMDRNKNKTKREYTGENTILMLWLWPSTTHDM